VIKRLYPRAAFANVVTEAARVSLNKIRMKSTNADFDYSSLPSLVNVSPVHHTNRHTLVLPSNWPNAKRTPVCLVAECFPALSLREGRCGELTSLRGNRKHRLPRRLSGGEGPFFGLRMEDLFPVPVVTPLRNAENGCAVTQNPWRGAARALPVEDG
jgi:hypothetical protein